jgi:anti-sigma B factor antagonist
VGKDVLLDVDTWCDKGRAVVEIDGELDLFSAPVLRDALLQLSGDGQHFLVAELSRLKFMDSSGLGVLVGAAKRATVGGGALCVAGASERVVKVLRVTGLLRVMPTFPTVQDAFAWLDQVRETRLAAARRPVTPGP